MSVELHFAKTIEHLNEFRILIRVLKIKNPDYYLIASEDLEQNEYVIDYKQKRIEVSEKSSIQNIISSILFSIGQIQFLDNKEYQLTFRVPRLKSMDYIYAISDIAEEYDLKSAEWANKTAEIMFPNMDLKPIIDSLVWNKFKWRSFFEGKK